jgi:hypothetical protein
MEVKGIRKLSNWIATCAVENLTKLWKGFGRYFHGDPANA